MHILFYIKYSLHKYIIIIFYALILAQYNIRAQKANKYNTYLFINYVNTIQLKFLSTVRSHLALLIPSVIINFIFNYFVHSIINYLHLLAHVYIVLVTPNILSIHQK